MDVKLIKKSIKSNLERTAYDVSFDVTAGIPVNTCINRHFITIPKKKSAVLPTQTSVTV